MTSSEEVSISCLTHRIISNPKGLCALKSPNNSRKDEKASVRFYTQPKPKLCNQLGQLNTHQQRHTHTHTHSKLELDTIGTNNVAGSSSSPHRFIHCISTAGEELAVWICWIESPTSFPLVPFSSSLPHFSPIFPSPCLKSFSFELIFKKAQLTHTHGK